MTDLQLSLQLSRADACGSGFDRKFECLTISVAPD
jgi:hypothetical protein